jgi:hypothetical protein
MIVTGGKNITVNQSIEKHVKATQQQYNEAVKVYECLGPSAVFAFAEKIGVDSYSFCRDCEDDTPDCHDDSCLVCGIYKPNYIKPQQMKRYKIPCVWEVYGYMNIEAGSIREAIKIAEDESTKLPTESSYIEGSFWVDYDGIDYDENELFDEQPTIEPNS